MPDDDSPLQTPKPAQPPQVGLPPAWRQGRGGQPLKLTPELGAQICSFISAGAFDWVAAQAVHISPRTFYLWMAKGDGADATEPYITFRNAVLTARAQARLVTELEIRRDNPFAWLRYGPGRDRPGEPGWTDSVVVTPGEPLVVRIEFADRNPPAPASAPVTTNGDRRDAKI